METSLDRKPNNLDSLLSATVVLWPWPKNNLSFYFYKKLRKLGLDQMISKVFF